MRGGGQVRAAGGVVWRAREGAIEVLLVHRPRYDDWSMPKGKLDEGETFEEAAVREVAEETGVVAALGEDLGQVAYTDLKGRDKVVRWWAMAAPDAEAGRPVDPEEVDEVVWLALPAARDRLTYALDVEVLDRFRATVER